MRFFVDENIPYSDETFGLVGEVVRGDGRRVSRASLAEIDALIVRSTTRVDAALLSQTSVKFVGSCTIGTDHIDQEYLHNENIAFAHAPGCNAQAVAEFVVAALLSTCATEGRRLQALTVGIVGVGNVGRRLWHLLKSLGVRCLLNDPPLAADAAGGERGSPDHWSDLETLISESDVISLHVPLITTGEHPTKGLLGARQIERLKSGAMIINTCRGGVVDEAALRTREDLVPLLDVWENEPTISLDMLQRTAIATPHIAGYSWLGKFQGTVMVYQALCRSLGVKEEGLTIDQPFKEVHVAKDYHHFEALLGAIVSQFYSVTADDQALRTALLKDEDHSKPQQVHPFDMLRKRYNTRLEWSQVALVGLDTLPETEVKRLLALGFKQAAG